MRKVAIFILGAALGGLVGSALTLLLTPMAGSRLRSEVQNYTHHLREEVERAAVLRRKELERELASLRGEVITD